MLKIDANGMIVDVKVKPSRFRHIERGKMTVIAGIIVHQTGAATAKSTLNSYSQSFANGAHLLVDKDGSIYQTASLHQQTWHVGKLKARCLLEKSCTPSEEKALTKFDPTGEHRREIKKSTPHRFPGNQDSIGIELVGETLPDGKYVAVTSAQNISLAWLVDQLSKALSLKSAEVFRHPTVSRKNPTEASSATW